MYYIYVYIFSIIITSGGQLRLGISMVSLSSCFKLLEAVYLHIQNLCSMFFFELADLHVPCFRADPYGLQHPARVLFINLIINNFHN